MQYLIAYAGSMAALMVLDAFWLGIAMVDFYKAQIGHLMTDNIRFGAAALFYLFYIAGVVFFAVRPALAEGSGRRALLNGAVFGFMAYMTYDLTNLATLRDWPVIVVVYDILWGCFLSAASAWAGYAAARRFRP